MTAKNTHMAEQIYDYALTSLPRVKDRLSLTGTGNDAVLTRIINGVTDFIEGECGGRRFKISQYANEVHSILHARQCILPLKNIPIGTVTAVQYRVGLKSSPNWTDFNNDDWEVVDDGKSGLIEIYGLLQGINTARVSYTGGFNIDWASAGDGSGNHTLPADLSDLAERLVIKIFKKRDQEGKQSESIEGATVTYGKLLEEHDQAVIDRYRRLPEFV